MKMGLVGMGRMGAAMALRLIASGHEVTSFDRHPEKFKEPGPLQSAVVGSLKELVKNLARPGAIWLMTPPPAVDGMIAQLQPLLQPDDVIIDGGNSFYGDDIRRSKT